MNEHHENLGFGLVALVPIACCIGLPLIAAASIGVAVAAWAVGLALGTLVLVAAVVLLVARALRRRQAPPTSSLRGHL